MRQSDFPANKDTRAFLDNLLRLVESGMDDQIGLIDSRKTMSGILAGTERIWRLSETVSSLSTTWINFGNGMLCVIGGAKRQSTIDAFVAESNVFRSNPDYNGFAPLVEDFANIAFGMLSTNHIPISTPIFLAGYSLGGCVCYKLADLLNTAGLSVPNIWTFGSPRPGGQAAARVCDRFKIRRYYGIDDPVRAIPPHFSEAWSVWPLLNQFTRNKWNAQVQPAGGICIDGGGYFIEGADVHPASGGETIFSVASYYLGLETTGASNHSIATYRSRITNLPETASAHPVGTIRDRGESPATPTAAETREVVELGIAAQEVAARQHFRPINLVVGTQQAGSSEPYRPQRVGDLWVILKGTEVIDVGPGKRGARNKARHWNRAVRAAQ